MRVPVLSLHNPELELWLTEGSHAESGCQLTLMDSQNRHYRPAEIRGLLLVREHTCPRQLYDTAQQAGYPVMWID